MSVTGGFARWSCQPIAPGDNARLAYTAENSLHAEGVYSTADKYIYRGILDKEMRYETAFRLNRNPLLNGHATQTMDR